MTRAAPKVRTIEGERLPQAEISPNRSRFGGRPSGAEAERVSRDLLEAAKRLFMEQGFAATSMEAIAAAAGVTKRTLYRRMADKTAVFEAAVRLHAAEHIMPPLPAGAGRSLEDRLLTASDYLLDWILQPDVLAMYRITIAEAARFPSLARIVAEVAVAQTTSAIEQILLAATPTMRPEDIRLGAEQFMLAVAAGPFHSAVQGIDAPGMTPAKRERVRRNVRLFLSGWAAFSAGRS